MIADVAPRLEQPPVLDTAERIRRDAPWTVATETGVAIGEQAKRSGLAIGDFFTRTSKNIAGSFSAPSAP
jgi:hypothetical protein